MVTNPLLMATGIASGSRLLWLVNKASYAEVMRQVSYARRKVSQSSTKTTERSAIKPANLCSFVYDHPGSTCRNTLDLHNRSTRTRTMFDLFTRRRVMVLVEWNEVSTVNVKVKVEGWRENAQKLDDFGQIG